MSPDTPIEDRRFTDREVREILSQAVATRPAAGVASAEGTTLEELRAIGSDVGIDPRRVEEAARSLVYDGDTRPNRWLGGATTVRSERRVEGTFDPEDSPEALAVIRRIMGRQGEVEAIHGAIEWSDSTDAIERHLTISSKDGITTVRGSTNLSGFAGIAYGTVGSVGFVYGMISTVVMIKDAQMLPLLIFAILLPIVYGILRTVYAKKARDEDAKLQRAVDALAALPRTPGETE